MADTTLSEQAIANRSFDVTNNRINVSSTGAGATSDRVQGTANNGVAASGSPVQTGGVAQLVNPTAVTSGQIAQMMTDKVGRQVATLISLRELYAQNNTVIASSAAETTILTAGAAGVFHDLSEMIISNTSAIATQIDIKDATAGTTRFTVWVPANTTVPVNPITYITQATAANNWTATCSSATSTVSLFIQAFKNI